MPVEPEAELAERIAAKKALVVVGTGVSLASTGGEQLASWKGLIANAIPLHLTRAVWPAVTGAAVAA